jgi:signal transduction histidine kinase
LEPALLLLARGDAGASPIVRQEVDLLWLARQATRDVARLFEAREVSLSGVDDGALEARVDGGSIQARIDAGTRSHVSICADAAALRRLIRVLLENAAQHTPPGGRVAVSVEVDREPGRRPQGACAVLAVADTGCGIATEHVSRIFERFYRVDLARNREQGGHGLGLAIAQHIARAHDGEITVSSQPGVGTTFHVTFPLA